MKNLILLIFNLAILGISVSILVMAIDYLSTSTSFAYFVILSLLTCPVVAVMLGASENIFTQLKNGLSRKTR